MLAKGVRPGVAEGDGPLKTRRQGVGGVLSHHRGPGTNLPGGDQSTRHIGVFAGELLHQVLRRGRKQQHGPIYRVGEGASELIHIGQAVMAFGGKIDYFINTVFNYPTLAECYKVAAFDGINRLV